MARKKRVKSTIVTPRVAIGNNVVSSASCNIADLKLTSEFSDDALVEVSIDSSSYKCPMSALLPKDTFKSDVESYYNLTSDNIKSIGNLNYLSSDENYTFDVNHQNIVFTTSPSTESLSPTFTDADYNVLVARNDVRPITISKIIGIPKSASTKMFNLETDGFDVKQGPSSTNSIARPNVTMGVLTTKEAYTNSYTFHFKSTSNKSNAMVVNEYAAGPVNIFGLLSVSPKSGYEDKIKNVTLYLEYCDNTELFDDDTHWHIITSRVLPANEWGTHVSMMAYVQKNATVRLRTNLDTTMGSMNMGVFNNKNKGLFGHKLGSLTSHNANTFVMINRSGVNNG